MSREVLIPLSPCLTNDRDIEYNYIPDDIQPLRLFFSMGSHLTLLWPFYVFFFPKRRFLIGFSSEFSYLLLAIVYSILYHGFAGTCHPMANTLAAADRIVASGTLVHLPGLVFYFNQPLERNRLTSYLLAPYFLFSIFWVYFPVLVIVPVFVLRINALPRFPLNSRLLRLLLFIAFGATVWFFSEGTYGFLFHSAWHLLVALIISDTLLYLDEL